MQLTGEPPPPSPVQTSTWRIVEGHAKGAPGPLIIYLVGWEIFKSKGETPVLGMFRYHFEGIVKRRKGVGRLS